MTTMPLPRFCLTLLPPWPQAIAFAGKTLENRGYGVARQLSGYRGLVGLSQSKTWDDIDCLAALRSFGALDKGNVDETWSEFRRTAGKLWLVAELIYIASPEFMTADFMPGHAYEDAKKWHVPGQWGLILGSVWEVEPVPCMGGQGAWRPQWCAACKKIIADSHGLTCKTCLSKLVSGPECPTLQVVREVGAEP